VNVGGVKGAANSYAHVVKGNYYPKEVIYSSPSLVLDDSCLNQKYSLCLLGKVKDFASLLNLKVVLDNEGFMNIELKYMGWFWVMLEFHDEGAKKKFQSNSATGTWVSQIIQAYSYFTIDERVTWAEIEGVPCKLWSGNTFSRIASRWGTLLDGDDRRRWVIWVRAKEVLGWVPDFVEDIEEESDSDDDSYEGEIKSGGLKFSAVSDVEGDSDVEVVPESKFKEEPKKHTGDDASVGHNKGFNFELTILNNKVVNDVGESICSGHFRKSEVPRTGGSIIQLMDDLVNVGQSIGYDMTGCMKNMEEIIESQRVKEVHR
ncbi:hypothetical protein Tco_0179429, partial [Tanacetum coccineum]